MTTSQSIAGIVEQERMRDMELNITKIVEDKMQEMEEQKTIEKLIENTLQKSIQCAVESVLGGWDLRRELEQKFKNEISGIVNDVGLSSYNQYIADTFRRLTEVQMKEDIKEKIVASFENIFVKKREKITLSELVEAYKSYLREEASEEYEDGGFELTVEEKDKGDRYFEIYEVTLEPDKELRRHCCGSGKALFKIMNNKIWDVKFNGQRLDKLESLRYMNDFECLLASLFFNETVVEVDLEEGTYTYEL